MPTLTEKFAHIYQVINTDGFLKMEALGGEIPFWIAPYDASLANETDREILLLEKKLLANGIKPLVIDLFSLTCELVDQHIGLDKMFEVEKKKDKERFKKALRSTVNIHERLIPGIVQRTREENPRLLILKGVGAVYPFIRSHTVLNNLQSAITEIPTIMFFPGEFSGRSLNLFGLLTDDNYYRAFNIDDYKL